LKSHRSIRLTHLAHLKIFLLGALGMALSPAACSNEPELEKDPVVGCQTPADCGEGGVCRLDGTCGDGSCTTPADCATDQFCASWGSCEPKCASCGNTCENTMGCPLGQHCSGTICQQECQPGTEGGVCGALVCNEDGKCESPDDIVVPASGGSTATGGMGGGPACIDVEVTFEPVIPNVVLLIDQSGSMNDMDGFGPAVEDAIAAGYTPWDCTETDRDDNVISTEDYRWNVVRNVLFHPDTGVVKPLENSVRFGYASYTYDVDEATCPQLQEVAIDFGTHAAMLAEHACNDFPPSGNTPTRESLTQVAEQFAATTLEGPKIIVLATDGLPDNCTCENWSQSGECASANCDEDEMVDRGGTMMCPEQAEQYDVVIEAQRIHEELGITIEVINVSSPDSAALAAHLDDVAERGGALGGVAIDGFNPVALTDAFQTIINGVRSCAIDLDGTITAGKENTGVVTVDGVELLYNGPDGWKVNSPTQIELVGMACETIKSGDHDIDVSFPCDAFIPIPVK
jgi:hypothetical protein